jgi:hypothetical protein
MWVALFCVAFHISLFFSLFLSLPLSLSLTLSLSFSHCVSQCVSVFLSQCLCLSLNLSLSCTIYTHFHSTLPTYITIFWRLSTLIIPLNCHLGAKASTFFSTPGLMRNIWHFLEKFIPFYFTSTRLILHWICIFRFTSMCNHELDSSKNRSLAKNVLLMFRLYLM